MNTPILFHSYNRLGNWKKILNKLNNLFNVQIDLNITIEEFKNKYIAILPRSFIFINCEENFIKKQNIIEKIRNFKMTSFSTLKVCVIHCIDLTSIYVQNAILKDLEEDEDVHYVLTTTSFTQVLPTLMSRVIAFSSASRSTFNQKLISIAYNYRLTLKKEEIFENIQKLKGNDISFIIAKLNDMDVLKISLIWMIITLEKLEKLELVLSFKLAKQLASIEKALNLNALGYFSKQIILSAFFKEFKCK